MCVLMFLSLSPPWIYKIDNWLLNWITAVFPFAPLNYVTIQFFTSFCLSFTPKRLQWSRVWLYFCQWYTNWNSLVVCHAEMNAILNKNSVDLKGCCIYVALFPCNECTKLIIQAGIKEVIFYSDKYHSQPTCKASRRLLDLAGVNYRYLDLLLLLFGCDIVVETSNLLPFQTLSLLSTVATRHGRLNKKWLWKL